VSVSLDLGIEHHLGDSKAVPQIDEDESTKVSPSINPAAKSDFLARIAGPQCAAGDSSNDLWGNVD
jgi:hypothetical protein